MTDFHSDRTIKATRRPRICGQCSKKIEVGSPAHYAFGRYYGDTYSGYDHIECHLAAVEYAKLNNLWGDEFPWLIDMEGSADHWLLEYHPVVAERLGIGDELFDQWIDELRDAVIHDEFGYEEGEFSVTPELWRPLFDEGLSPLDAFKRALKAARSPAEALS